MKISGKKGVEEITFYSYLIFSALKICLIGLLSTLLLETYFLDQIVVSTRMLL